MNDICSSLISKIEAFQPHAPSPQGSEGDSYEDDVVCASPPPPSSDSDWGAPSISLTKVQGVQNIDLDFRPETNEANPPVPQPTPHLSIEGTECQR